MRSRGGGLSNIGVDRFWLSGRSRPPVGGFAQALRNIVLAGAPPRERGGVTGGDRRPRGGLRGRTTGADGAARSRYQSGGPGGTQGGGRPPCAEPSRPWRRTRRPEEPSARTPALGWPAGALRWRVTDASRSVCKSAALSLSGEPQLGGRPGGKEALSSPRVTQQFLGVRGGFSLEVKFSKTGFPKSCRW